MDIDYWILHTDYDNYAYVYGCDVQKVDGTCQESHAWVWSRTNNLTEEHRNQIDTFITESCVDSADFMLLVQGKCKKKIICST